MHFYSSGRRRRARTAVRDGPPADFVPIHVYVFMCANHMCVFDLYGCARVSNAEHSSHFSRAYSLCASTKPHVSRMVSELINVVFTFTPTANTG